MTLEEGQKLGGDCYQDPPWTLDAAGACVKHQAVPGKAGHAVHRLAWCQGATCLLHQLEGLWGCCPGLCVPILAGPQMHLVKMLRLLREMLRL